MSAPRGKDRVYVAHNDNGRIHVQFNADSDTEDFYIDNEDVNMPDYVDLNVERQPIKILGWRLK